MDDEFAQEIHELEQLVKMDLEERETGGVVEKDMTRGIVYLGCLASGLIMIVVHALVEWVPFLVMTAELIATSLEHDLMVRFWHHREGKK